MKEEALQVLRDRRSIRKYKAEQVGEAGLKTVLEAGTYGATGAGTQSPMIVAVQNSEQVALIDRLNAEVLGAGKNPHPYYGAPTILLVFASPSGRTPYEDAIIVAANLINAAYAAGLGSCWINRSKQVFETAEGKALMQEWGIPADCYCASSIALGYADCEQPVAAPRKADYYRIIK